MTVPPEAAGAPAPVAASAPLSPLQRAVNVFVRPGEAWSGLDTRAQWWIPVLVLAVLAVASQALLFRRAMLPMQLEMLQRMADAGQIPAERLDAMTARMQGGMAYGQALIGGFLAMWVIALLQATMLLFGVGFILGGRLRFRMALEVAAWGSLVYVPMNLLTAAIAYVQQSMDVRLSPAVLLPAMADANRLQMFFIFFLSSLSPFGIWWLAVAVIGASTLSGAPRKNVTWVMSALYFALAALFAAVGALLRPVV